MRAMIARQWCEPAELDYAEAPEPRPQPGEVLIETRAIGCNFFDILMVQGKYQVRPPLPFSPGNEVAGVIREAGPAAGDFAPGDRVFATPDWGGFATVAIAPESSIHRMPDAMPFDE